MNQSAALLQTIKRELKSQGLTYKDVAGELGLSENSVKRLFAEQSTTLERLERLSDIVGLSLADLVRKMEATTARVEVLTVEQEKMIVSDVKLLLVSICVLHFWRFEDIVEQYKISETECIQLLAKLDRLKLIELQPLNRFRLLVAKNFRWREGGPVQNFFRTEVQGDFFQSDFKSPGEKLVFVSGMLSRSSHHNIEKLMGRLAYEFNSAHREDADIPLDDRFGSSMVLAIRSWEYKAFIDLRRKSNTKVF